MCKKTTERGNWQTTLGESILEVMTRRSHACRWAGEGRNGERDLAKKYGPRPSLAGGLKGSPKFQNPEATWPGRPRKGRALGRRLLVLMVLQVTVFGESAGSILIAQLFLDPSFGDLVRAGVSYIQISFGDNTTHNKIFDKF